MESFTRMEELGKWNGEIEPLLAAAEAAQEVGGFDGAVVTARLKWPERQGDHHSLDGVRERLRHGPPPIALYVYVSAIRGSLSPASVTIHVWGLGPAVYLEGEGTDWDRGLRAYEAARFALIESAVAVPEPEHDPPAMSAKTFMSALAGESPASSSVQQSPTPSGWRPWIERNQVFLGLAIAALGVIVAVLAIALA